MDGYAPAGAVVSTVTDMSRLATSLLDGSAPGHRSLRELEGVKTDRADRATGMFWMIDRVPGTDGSMIWHNGQTGGHSAFFALSRRPIEQSSFWQTSREQPSSNASLSHS
jgi:CubicO group peptidase (beta-lactamase class C family)